jgi:polyisoprenoid-binding protein YceI
MAWILDPAHTRIGFSARHMGLATVRGQFNRFEGTLKGDPSDITSAEARIEVDLNSVDTGDERRDQHLRSPDFFDVANHPKMIFVSQRITPNGDGAYSVIGDLTIKDVTRQIELEYEHAGDGFDPYGNRKIGGTLTGTVNRSDWDLRWNVALETGGWLVSEKVKLEIDVEVGESQDAVDREAEEEAKLSA